MREEFDDLLWVTVGEDITGAALAAKITSLAQQFDPTVAAVTEPLAAGAQLGRVLRDRRALLVIDLWLSGQVAPFLVGGDRVVRLFTTRQRDVLPVQTVPIQVDQMETDEASELLTTGLSRVPSALVSEALRVTGRWSVLLSLVHGAVDDAVAAGADAESELGEVLTALRTYGGHRFGRRQPRRPEARRSRQRSRCRCVDYRTSCGGTRGWRSSART